MEPRSAHRETAGTPNPTQSAPLPPGGSFHRRNAEARVPTVAACSRGPSVVGSTGHRSVSMNIGSARMAMVVDALWGNGPQLRLQHGRRLS